MPDKHTVIDPYVFSLPNGTRDECLAAFKRLELWSRRIQENIECYSTSELSVYAMMDDGRYPTLTRIKEVINRLGISGYSPIDLSNMLRVLGSV